MRKAKDNRPVMKVGDRIMVHGGFDKKIMKVARVDIPFSTERAFATKSGGDFTIGRRIWKMDYSWNDKNKMWIPKR